MTPPRPGAVVIGLGNPWRRDDGAGHAVAVRVGERLVGTAGGRARIVLLDGEPGRVLDAWDGAELAVVVDAVRSGEAAGTVTLLDPSLDAGTSPSSHGLGLAEAVALGRQLARLPRRLVVVGVVGADFDDGEHLSPPVAGAVDRAASIVLSLVGGGTGPTVPAHGAVDARPRPSRRGGPAGAAS